jgi:hypothetical protein
MTLNNGQFNFDDANGATISVKTVVVDAEGNRTYTEPSVVIYQSADVPGSKAIYHELVRESHRLGVGK